MAENRENDRHNPPEAIPIRDHFRPVISTHYSGIAQRTINLNNFELKPALISMGPSKKMASIGSLGKYHDMTGAGNEFLAKYFPPAKSEQLKIEISTFRQTDFEQLYEAWEMYKELSRKCPNHGFEDWVKIELFYNSLNGQTRETVGATAGGTIFAKSPDQAYDLLEQMTINSYQWPFERSGVKRTTGISTVDPITSLIAQNFGGYVGYRGYLPPNTYHPGLRNHENFSYANNKNVLNPPPGFKTSNGEGKPSFEDLVGTFVAKSGKRMARTESRIDNLETHIANIGASSRILESQVWQIMKQLKSQPLGTVPKTANPNLREKEKKKRLIPHPSGKISHHQPKASEIREEEVAFTEGGDEGIQRNLPQKMQDPGEFVVPCAIGGQRVGKTICDSGASVNVISNSLYEKLGLSKMKPTELILQLTDKSVKAMLGFVEFVEIQIDKLRFSTYFVVLDIENSQNVHIILGRPCLAIAGAVIDVK
ncbi:uncharacterized protein [Primulina huaijiensis]|uniref:uncharacterized protein n=1 Tax=Primulina huaijiensis TaxID=1492673 RepID=UPI003CC6F6DD